MQGDPHVRFDEQGVETGCLVSPTGEPHDTAPPPDSTSPCCAIHHLPHSLYGRWVVSSDAKRLMTL